MSVLLSIGRREPREDLVGLLLACHERIRSFTRLALELGTREDVSPELVVEDCRRCERYFREALPLHVQDEEESVRPRLVGRRAELDEVLEAMEWQHQEHEPQVAALLDALRALSARPESAAARSTLRGVALELQRAFEAHLALEEGVIFPAIRARIPGEEQERAIQELRARRARVTPHALEHLEPQ